MARNHVAFHNDFTLIISPHLKRQRSKYTHVHPFLQKQTPCRNFPRPEFRGKNEGQIHKPIADCRLLDEVKKQKERLKTACVNCLDVFIKNIFS